MVEGGVGLGEGVDALVEERACSSLLVEEAGGEVEFRGYDWEREAGVDASDMADSVEEVFLEVSRCWQVACPYCFH